MALAQREPPPFTTRLRLDQVSFPGGVGDAFVRAKGGAFGKVVLGDLAGEPVAVKILSESGTARVHFQSEADVLLCLRTHVDAVRQLGARGVSLGLDEAGGRHVAYALGTGEEPDLAALDRRLPPGRAFLIAVEPLAQTLEESVLLRGAPLGELLRVAHEIACALAFLARCNIVVRRKGSMRLASNSYVALRPLLQHSDLKPDNVMLASDGRPVVCDFGVARVTAPGEATTRPSYGGHGGAVFFGC